MALFAEPLFGEAQFDFNAYAIALFDSSTLSDAISKSMSLTLQDSQNTVDAISDGVSLAALLDTLSVSTDVIKNRPTKVLSDSMSFADALQGFGITKVLPETITMASSITFSDQTLFFDFIFFFETIHVDISNKALTDAIRLNDWLTVKLVAAEPWSD